MACNGTALPLPRKIRDFLSDIIYHNKILSKKVKQTRYRPGRTREFQKVKDPKFRDNGTLVQALRLCTGRTVLRGSIGIGKGKVQRCTGTEALYRPYGP